jgi:hypothetical protein
MTQFPLLAASTPMLGRGRVFERICSDLTKPTPQHISIVGPRFIGKSVLIEAIASKMGAEGKYTCVLTWDLGHQTPQTDDDFLAGLRKRVAAGLKTSRPDIADYLMEASAGYPELLEVIDTLGKEGLKILMLWDGFDRPLSSGKLTRNLWDNLLELCRQKGFVLVVATRRKLQELIRDEKSVTSEFWLVFETVKLGPLDGTEVRVIVDSVADVKFQPSSVSELMNWSGGIPVLLVCLLNRLLEAPAVGVITNDHVNAAATRLDEKTSGLIERIWTDLPVVAGDLFLHLAKVSECALADTAKAERLLLVDMGLAKQSDHKLHLNCKLVARHVSGLGHSKGLIGDLFGKWEAYQANVRGLLERRLSQVPGFDATLCHMVAQGIRDIPSHPDVCLNNLTHIEDRALDLIWEREFGPERKIPSEVVGYWTEGQRSRNKFVSEMMDSDQWEVGSERGKQLALLQLLTGSHQDFTKVVAKHTSKDTYVLLNAIHCFRNRSQHSGGQQIHLGVAVAAIMLCIELLGCLARENPKSSSST